jgi:PKD repeat protein
MVLFSCQHQNLPQARIGEIDPSLVLGQAQVGDTLIFTNYSVNADHYLWDFGDGIRSNSSASSIVHIYISAGTFVASLTAFDKNSNSSKDILSEVIEPISGNVCFWFSTPSVYGHTVVTIGTLKDSIKSATGLPPSCVNTNCANFKIAPGVYSYSASEVAPGTHTWNGNITITKHGCVKQQLL